VSTWSERRVLTEEDAEEKRRREEGWWTMNAMTKISLLSFYAQAATPF
jgi:hypothetical protein